MSRVAQITLSPYYGTPDFSAMPAAAPADAIDDVSLADLLRNGFVYPPHSIYRGLKLVTFGFCPDQDMARDPDFHFKFRNAGEVPETVATAQDWVGNYHRLLCEAIDKECAGMGAPWQLQSGGKDSTSLAIALADARPETVCITYRGGHEENEVDSATLVARKLGLRHVTLECDPGRAYDRYLAMVSHLPLLTADFALLSYFDLAAEIADHDGDGMIDGLGADSYFGTPLSRHHRWMKRLAQGLRLPRGTTGFPFIEKSFPLCYLAATLQMDPIERTFPGSRFGDDEVDELLGRPLAASSRARLDLFRREIASASSAWEWRDMSMSIAGSAAAFAKGLLVGETFGLRTAYPYCDARLRDWIHKEVPREQKVDLRTHENKVLMRRHIATRFDDLPYVRGKGSFRFDLRGLARRRFDQVRAFAETAGDMLPGATAWLDGNRRRLDNKYHASRFYLLAVILPWLLSRRAQADAHA